MNKDQKTIVSEYISSLSEEKLDFLNTRLTEKFLGDVPAALEELSKDKKVDSLLSNCSSAEEIFSILDNIKDLLQKECKKKGLFSKV